MEFRQKDVAVTASGVETDYVIRVVQTPQEVDAAAWNQLLAQQAQATPFMRSEYLAALHTSGSAVPRTGWAPHFITLWRAEVLEAACVLYVKPHSYGEYVFDWAWADAYQRHGLDYYPKAVVAVPFTPVPGARLLARSAEARAVLAQGLVQWCEAQQLSSLHILFASADDLVACESLGLMQRQTVQFHWRNATPEGQAFTDFPHFLASLHRDKRKKIQQERRRVADAGVRFRWARGRDITAQDWDFFYQCYERTYLEHGNPPYLQRSFFQAMADTQAEAWLLFIAERDGQPIASSLIALSQGISSANGQFDAENPPRTAYGRYWGALERVDCLHFEACYYQPLEWCIQHGVQQFEGGAQGEHKMARALMPVRTHSAHWLAHPGFAEAVENFLAREGQGMDAYVDELGRHTPFKNAASPGKPAEST